ncbi:hypothetical protein V7S57_02545 [Caulobacter sp. CCNWLY153]|uniref:hypothetical protein n=1 Tax=unclassified Caulobacter TaxID=2648921 RepID=UPI002FF28D86
MHSISLQLVSELEAYEAGRQAEDYQPPAYVLLTRDEELALLAKWAPPGSVGRLTRWNGLTVVAVPNSAFPNRIVSWAELHMHGVYRPAGYVVMSTPVAEPFSWVRQRFEARDQVVIDKPAALGFTEQAGVTAWAEHWRRINGDTVDASFWEGQLGVPWVAAVDLAIDDPNATRLHMKPPRIGGGL